MEELDHPMCLSWEGVCVQRRLPYSETHSVASETLDKETVNVVMLSAETEHRSLVEIESRDIQLKQLFLALLNVVQYFVKHFHIALHYCLK